MEVDESRCIICPVDKAVKLINKKWIIQIIRDMFFGKTRFKEFKEDKPDLSNKVLSNCLKEMVSNKLIDRVVTDEGSSVNVDYYLTEHGRALNKVIYELAMFTLDEDIHDEIYDDSTKNELRSVFKETLDIE